MIDGKTGERKKERKKDRKIDGKTEKELKD